MRVSRTLLATLLLAGCAEPTGRPSPTAAAPSEPTATDVDGPTYVEGGVAVTVESVAVGPVTLIHFGEPQSPRGRYLHVRVRITNESEGRKVDFLGWRNLTGHGASVTDDSGNRYRWVGFSLAEPADALRPGSVYPGQSVAGTVQFEPPLESAKTITVTLPMKAVGGVGVPRFTLPLRGGRVEQ